MKVKAGLGGMGAVTMSEPEKPHPSNHYEIHQMKIEKAANGGFVIHHHMMLKKKHMNKPGFQNGYRATEPEPEMHTAANVGEVIQHIKKHFGAPAKVSNKVPQASDEDEMGERDDEE